MLLKFDFGRIRKQEHLIWLIAAESLDFIFLISFKLLDEKTKIVGFVFIMPNDNEERR